MSIAFITLHFFSTTIFSQISEDVIELDLAGSLPQACEQPWFENGVKLYFSTTKFGSCHFDSQSDPIWLYPASLKFELDTTLGYKYTRVEADIFDYCGQNCTTIELFDLKKRKIGSSGNTSTSKFETLRAVNSSANNIVTGKIEAGEGNIFNIRIYYLPCAISLYEPINLQENLDTIIVFKWAKIDNVASYTLEIATDLNFSKNIYTKIIKQPTKGKDTIMSDTLKNLFKYNNKYYWKVSSILPDCGKIISNIYCFTTKGEILIYSNFIETGNISLVKKIYSDEDKIDELKIVADGTISLILKSSNKKANIKIYASETDENKIGLISSKIVGDTIVFEYKAPSEFYDGEIKFAYDLIETKQNPDIEIPISIKPTPVIFLHGLASDGETWDDMLYILTQDEWDIQYLFNPSYKNDISFEVSSLIIPSYIRFAINQLRSSNVFVNQASIVGHSMGGLVARHYIQNVSHLSNEIGYKNIDRLITINTPHSGSEIANLILDEKYDGWGKNIANFTFFIKSLFGSNAEIENGAIKSLRVNSEEIERLNSSIASIDIPVFSISHIYEECDYEKIPILEADKALDTIINFLKTVNFFGAATYFLNNDFCYVWKYLLGNENDLIVRNISQIGGLDKKFTSTSFGATHLDINNISTTEDIKNLLKSNPEVEFSSKWFKPEKLDVPLHLPFIENRTDTMTEINIINFVNYDTINTNLNTKKIKVAGNENVKRIAVVYFFENDSIIYNVIDGQNVTLEIPKIDNFEGKLRIGILGSDGYGHVDFDTLILIANNDFISSQKNIYGIENIQLFPNPVHKDVKISSTEIIHEYAIFDFLGHKIINQLNFNENILELNMSKFVEGVYYISMKINNKILTRKFIVN